MNTQLNTSCTEERAAKDQKKKKKRTCSHFRPYTWQSSTVQDESYNVDNRCEGQSDR